MSRPSIDLDTWRKRILLKSSLIMCEGRQRFRESTSRARVFLSVNKQKTIYAIHFLAFVVDKFPVDVHRRVSQSHKSDSLVVDDAVRLEKEENMFLH